MFAQPNPFIRLINSSKAIVMVVAIVAICVLAGLKMIAAPDAVTFVKWVVTAWLGAVALEDAASKSTSPATEAQASPGAPAARLLAATNPGQINIAVVNKAKRVTDNEVQLMSYACAWQLAKHAAPAWKRTAPTLTFYPDPSRVPPDAYLITIVDDPDVDGALGYHTAMETGAVRAFIFTSPVLDNGGAALYDPRNPQNTTVASVLSHEALEAFCDPCCNLWADDGNKSYSYENSDAVEGDSYAIRVKGHLVSVSNFVTPEWFDSRSLGARYDYLGKLTAPFTMTSGGYVTTRAVGRESQEFGEKMPAWKRTLKSMKYGHGGSKLK